jgi:hypothetical protein
VPPVLARLPGRRLRASAVLRRAAALLAVLAASGRRALPRPAPALAARRRFSPSRAAARSAARPSLPAARVPRGSLSRRSCCAPLRPPGCCAALRPPVGSPSAPGLCPSLLPGFARRVVVRRLLALCGSVAASASVPGSLAASCPSPCALFASLLLSGGRGRALRGAPLRGVPPLCWRFAPPLGVGSRSRALTSPPGVGQGRCFAAPPPLTGSRRRGDGFQAACLAPLFRRLSQLRKCVIKKS